jgi:hypothetical protein
MQYSNSPYGKLGQQKEQFPEISRFRSESIAEEGVIIA